MLSLFQRRKPSPQPLFIPGTLQMSDQVRWLASNGLIDPLPYVQRHVRGDWGQVGDAERQANDMALECGAPMTSRFPITPKLSLVVITSADQGRTVVQLPDERAVT